MAPRNTRVLVFATALMMAPILPVWSQPPVHRPQPAKKAPPKGEVIVKSDTPIDAADPQAQPGQAAAQDPATAQAAQGNAPQGQTQPPADPSMQPAPPAQPAAPGQPAAPAQPSTPPANDSMTAPSPNAGKGIPPEQMGLSFAPPQGWQQGDPTKFTVPGNICCVWSPDNISSISIFAQNSGKP
jgi:hypothetical protein